MSQQCRVAWGQDFIYYQAGAHVFYTTIGNNNETEACRMLSNTQVRKLELGGDRHDSLLDDRR
jgi:hypothetical protein